MSRPLNEKLLTLPAWSLALAAMGISFICLLPTLSNGWVNWDDGAYVLRNPLVWDLSWEGLKTMFTTPEQVGLYHPLTLLSLAVDHAVWGKEAFGFHLSNLLLHLLNVLLVFVLFQRLSGRTSVAFVVALLFGMHPMHVESVAWISARKDVLYTLFWLSSLLAYLNFRKCESKRRLGLLFLAFILFVAALLSKAMAFSLPVIFLLVDRFQERKWSAQVWLEKLPFFAFAVVALWVARMGQQDSESMLAVTEYPFYKTIFIGMRNLLSYGFQAIFPVQLTPFHPFPFMGKIELPILYYLAVLPIMVGAWLLVRSWKSWPKVFLGLAFFLICIGPQLQIIPYGKAVTAERYTYVAYLGLFWLLAWGVDSFWQDGNAKRKMGIAIVGGIWLLFLGGQAFQQSKVWKNGETLWSDVVQDYPEHYFGHYNRGKFRMEAGKPEDALTDLEKAVELEQEIGEIYYERARVSESLGGIEDAFSDYCRAIELDGGLARAYLNRGLLQATKRNQPDLGLADFESAIAIQPGYALAHINRGLLLRGKERHSDALESYSEAIRLEPWNPAWYMYRGVYHEAMNRLEPARSDFSQAHHLNPQSGEGLFFRARTLKKEGSLEEALKDAEAAERLGYELPQDFKESLVEFK